MRGRVKDAIANSTNFIRAALRPGSLRKPDGKGSLGWPEVFGRTNMRFSRPETGGFSQPQRAVGKPRNLHKLKRHRVWDRTRVSLVRRPRFHGATARPLKFLV